MPLKKFLNHLFPDRIMKKLEARFIPGINSSSAVGDISLLLDKQHRHFINELSWPDYAYRPDVSFAIAHGGDCIFIKYYVLENSVRAKTLQTNGPVYQDSCVEFFVAFAGEKAYYNFEFNCIGTCLAGYGDCREGRRLLPESVIEKIRYQATLVNEANNEEDRINWQLTLVLPLEVFHFHRLSSLKGIRCRVNFFKCGDELPRPHYLSWNYIDTPKPDFHQSVFFGEAEFA